MKSIRSLATSILQTARAGRRPRGGRSRVAAVESLETRALLSNVTVSFKGGDLIVKGDHQSNDIRVTSTPGSGTSVTGHNGTTVNGGSSFMSYNAIDDDLRLSMGGGNNHVVVTADLPGTLQFKSSHGNDQFGVLYGTYGSISAKTSGGNDMVVIVPQNVNGSVNVNTGHGNDGVGIAGSISGSLTVNSGHGRDGVLFDGLATGNLNLKTGSGQDEVFIRNTTANGNFKAHLGHGNDEMWIAQGSHQANSTIHGGGGTDNVEQSTVVVNGERKISSVEGTSVPNELNRFYALAGQLNDVWDI